MNKKKLLAAGGDLRMLYAAARLSDKYDVEITGFSAEKLPAGMQEIFSGLKQMESDADILLLPPVVTGKSGKLKAPYAEKEMETEEILKKVKKGGAVLMGIKGEKIKDAAEMRSLQCCNYMEDSTLALANAVPTAEAAMKIIIEETGSTIWGANILVTGFGRIGSVLTDRLLKMSACVTTAARKEYDRMRIKAAGGTPAEIMPCEKVLSEAEVIINTVPARIFGEKEFLCIKKGCVFIELASAPGGADKNEAEKYGCRYVCASGLPAFGMS